MRHAQPRQYFASTQRAVANADAIEWEELPSLASSLAERLVSRSRWQRDDATLQGANDSRFQASRSFSNAWDSTVPAALDTLPAQPPTPFREALQGLSTREVHEPDLFRHFFGADAAVR